ncbi:hypothetical protein GOP47_0005174 [Adiantum capillus-veneris]|uniref:CRM domain-containing protein n=1 Tax=Adiantum capillus-veneris TaxID=13818 RepID=A0A9D4V4L6_ADICA|nr:hypothetical protein GOP47_0005174 [Adiantum capillus-veneris]
MAVAPTALLLRPLPSLDNQASISTVSTASLAGSSSSHGSFSLFLHNRRPQGFRHAMARIMPVEENLSEEEQSFLALSSKRSARNPPPWEVSTSVPVSGTDSASVLKGRQNAAAANDSGAKDHTFRAAPWQQGSRGTHRSSGQGSPWEQGRSDGYAQEDDGTSARLANAEADKSAMAKIVEKLRRIQKAYRPADQAAGNNDKIGSAGKGGPRGSNFRTLSKKSAESYPKRAATKFSNGRAAAYSMPTAMQTESKPSTMQTENRVSDAESDGSSSKFPWERDEKEEKLERVLKANNRGPRVPTVAELTLPRDELIRLRLLGLQLDERLRVGKLGITKNIVISIQEQFRSSELVKVRCEGPAAASIKKTALDLEERTGGLVVLRTGKIIVVYRGSGYKPEERRVYGGSQKEVENLNSRQSRVSVQAETPLPATIAQEELGNKFFGLQEDGKGHVESESGRVSMTAMPSLSTDPYNKRESEAVSEAEAESILEGLGPRFENWTGLLPVPIDADLLPSVIPNYRPPFRLMPYGIRPRISDSELTNLRRLARPLAPHFVLGRNRGHQGLAAAIVKLWEKSEIAKVAVKRRVQNTNNLIMADELKQLTGGVLLSRDKFFLTFYRGKDFVPEKVAAALVEREESVRDLQEREEKAREERNIPVKWTPYAKPSISVIGEAAPAAKPSWMDTMDVKEQERLKKEAVKFQRITLTHELEKKLDLAMRKRKKAEEEIKKLDVFLNPIDRPIDVETITREERFMFEKLGRKMKAYLLIGRRGVFDGVVENMHLHWKHRELVKIVVKEVDVAEVEDIARTLEYESGGILVSVSWTQKGQAIIMYRGKNYQRPLELRPRNLLTKRKALKKSLEVQRHESLTKNIKSLQEQILSIQGELRKLGEVDGADDSGSNLGVDKTDQRLKSSEAQSNDLPFSGEDDSKSEDGKDTKLTEVKNTGSTFSESEMDSTNLQEQIKQLEKLVSSGPLYRAEPLSNSERLQLRREALLAGRAPQFFVGKNNGLEGLARGIRIYFLHHDLVQIVVKGRAPTMLIEDVIHDLEELTGGVLVSREAKKIVMYRGWPKGFSFPFAESLGNITPELLSALEAEEVWEDDSSREYRIEAESDDESDDGSEQEDNDESVHASTLVSDGESENESDQMAVWEYIDEGSDDDDVEDDEDEDDDDEKEDDAQELNWISQAQKDGSAESQHDSEADSEEDDDEDDLSWEDSEEEESLSPSVELRTHQAW